MRGLRLAVAMFTVLPVPSGWHGEVDRARAAATVRWLPLVGALLGALAGLPVAALVARDRGTALLAAALGIAALALLTRGLHLDGLADTADGLGSRAPAQRALEIMRRSDIGPFGVMTLVFVLAVDVAALALIGQDGGWRALAALAVAAATGRLAVVHAALAGVPSARGNGFGSLVAGSTSRVTVAALTGAVLAAGSALAAASGAGAAGWPLAQAVALATAFGLRLHTTRRFGGVTGDVFGALVECATAVTLVGLAVG